MDSDVVITILGMALIIAVIEVRTFSYFLKMNTLTSELKWFVEDELDKLKKG